MSKKVVDESLELLHPKKVHLIHCNQGEFEGSCKYGDADCPAMKAHPECDKMLAVKDKSQAIGEFIEWLGTKSMTIVRWAFKQK